MATPTALVSAASSSIFSPAISSPLIDKIHGFFGSKMACFVAGAAACLYTFYQAYQFSTHSAFGLSDHFKYVKCSALLLEADEAKGNITPLLQQCEALLATITDKRLSSEKEILLVKLVQHYAKTDPEHAYLLAQRLTYCVNLFNAAQTVQNQHPDFDKAKLLSLYRKADQAANNIYYIKPREFVFDWINWYLKLAKAYHSVEASNSCFRAHELALNIKNPLPQMKAFCEIAKCAHEIQNTEYMDPSIEPAKELLSQIPNENLIEAHLVLADAYLCLKKDKEMDQQLQQVKELFTKDPSTIHKHLPAFAKIIEKIRENQMIESDFHYTRVKSWIDLATENIGSLNARNHLEIQLNLESLYEDVLVGHTSENIDWKVKNSILFNNIAGLPEESEAEINAKIDLFIRLSSFDNESQIKLQIIEKLKELYNQCPAKSSGLWDQTRLGERIVALYNEMELADQSTPFLEQQISNILNDGVEIFKITHLAFYGSDYACSKEQKKAALEAAEKLLSQVKSSTERNFDLAQIAEGYLQVDREKSLAIMADLENRQARNCKVIGFVTAIATASIYFYPTVAPMLFLGAGVLRLYPSVISVVY